MVALASLLPAPRARRCATAASFFSAVSTPRKRDARPEKSNAGARPPRERSPEGDPDERAIAASEGSGRARRRRRRRRRDGEDEDEVVAAERVGVERAGGGSVVESVERRRAADAFSRGEFAGGLRRRRHLPREGREPAREVVRRGGGGRGVGGPRPRGGGQPVDEVAVVAVVERRDFVVVRLERGDGVGFARVEGSPARERHRAERVARSGARRARGVAHGLVHPRAHARGDAVVGRGRGFRRAPRLLRARGEPRLERVRGEARVVQPNAPSRRRGALVRQMRQEATNDELHLRAIRARARAEVDEKRHPPHAVPASGHRAAARSHPPRARATLARRSRVKSLSRQESGSGETLASWISERATLIILGAVVTFAPAGCPQSSDPSARRPPCCFWTVWR